MHVSVRSASGDETQALQREMIGWSVGSFQHPQSSTAKKVRLAHLLRCARTVADELVVMAWSVPPPGTSSR